MAEIDPPAPDRAETAPHSSAARGVHARFAAARARWRRLPLFARILLWVVGVLFLVWLILFVTRGRFLKAPFETIVSTAIQRKVDVAGDFQFYFAPVSIRFLADGLTVSNPGWTSRRHLFSAGRVDARIAPLSLLFGARRRITWLELRNGALDLEWRPDGRANSWTLGDPEKPGEPLDLPAVRRALITGTTLRYRDPRMQLATDISVDTVRAQDARFASDIRFQGTGTLRDRPFTLRGGLLSPDETAAGGRNQLALRADAGAMVMEATGTLPGATELDGADLAVTARGPNLRLLFDFLGVAIPDTRTFHVTSDLTKAGGAWRFTHLKGRFGDSDLTGGMTISLPGGRPLIEADLDTRTLDIIDVGPFIGYDPEKLEKAGATGIVETVSGHPRVLPDAPLRIDAIRAFDAKVRYHVRTIRADNVPVSNVGVDLTLDHSRLTLSPLTFDMAGGFVSSDIAIDARGAPVRTQYDIRLSPTPMGRLLSRWGVEQSGTSGVIKARVQMTGEGDSVHASLASADGRIAVILPAGTMWARNVQLSELDIGTFITKMFASKLKKPVEINCGLIAFTVRDGIATADPILIDTRKNVITGRGGFSFRDESLNMAVRADGKTISLFSGQSPVGIGGYFAKPGINPLSPELMARGGIGAGLGLVATPLASILAFVDVGDAKAAACGPVLAGADAAAQRTAKGKSREDVSGSGTAAPARPPSQKSGKFLGIF
ncbi:MAG: AsmA family protein [Sphingobium sp.]|nr:MAG: AsmA family protein [Sphingobium sp.]